MGIETKRRDLPSNRAYTFRFHWFVTAFSDDENDRHRRTIDNSGIIFFSFVCDVDIRGTPFSIVCLFFIKLFCHSEVVRCAQARIFLICYCFAIYARNDKKNVRKSISGIFFGLERAPHRSNDVIYDGFTSENTRERKQSTASKSLCNKCVH